MSYHIISYHILYHISYHIIYSIIYHVISCHIVSYRIISYHISYHISYRIVSYRIISYYVMSCHIISCYVMSCHIISYQIPVFWKASCSHPEFHLPVSLQACYLSAHLRVTIYNIFYFTHQMFALRISLLMPIKGKDKVLPRTGHEDLERE